MVIYRPHRSTLVDAMALAKEFETTETMIEHVCEEHNSRCDWFQITPEEIYIHPYGSDERVGWHNCFILCYERPSKIKNIEGYKRYFGITDEELTDTDDEPCGVMGMFSTDYTP